MIKQDVTIEALIEPIVIGSNRFTEIVKYGPDLPDFEAFYTKVKILNIKEQTASAMQLEFKKETEATKRLEIEHTTQRIKEEEATKRTIELTKQKEIDITRTDLINRRVSMVMDYPRIGEVEPEQLMGLLSKMVV